MAMYQSVKLRILVKECFDYDIGQVWLLCDKSLVQQGYLHEKILINFITIHQLASYSTLSFIIF